MRKKRLLWQLYASYLFITLAALAAVVWYASSAMHAFYSRQTLADLQARARLVERQTQPALVARDFAQLDAQAKALGRATDTRLTVVLPDGRVVADSLEAPAAMENHVDRPEIAAALAGEVGSDRRYSQTLREWQMYVALAAREDGKIIGVVRSSIAVTVFDETLWSLQLRVMLGGLVAAALGAAISLLFSRRLTRPLEELKAGAERFARGDLAYRLPVSDSQEVGALAETLNLMAEELSQRIGEAVSQRNERDAILASMVEGVVAVDMQQRLLRVNRAASLLVGVNGQTAAGRTLQETIRNPYLQQLAARVLDSQEPQEEEILLHHNGQRYLHVQGTPLRDAHDRPLGALLVLHEVTRLKRLEKVRRDFVANVSHELRTPVTSIKGFIETLLDGAMHNPEELPRFLQIVSAQTDRLNAILEDLLTLSRIEVEEENNEIALAPAAVRGVLDAAREVCQWKAAEKRLNIEITCDPALEAPMNGPLLEQAVINLLDNAVKYSPAEATIELSARQADGEVVIEVCDHGCGIAREHLPRIFERFYRVDKARSRKLGGTGLGLAIVKHIAQAHGGRATVESTVGEGSRFAIHLRLARR